MLVCLLLVISYLSGSICFSILLSSIFGFDDPRTYGSKNPGTFNAWRKYGSIFGITVLIFDSLKSVLPMLVALALFNEKTFMLLVGFFAFIGHVYPVFYQFKGGKGVATYLGIIFTLSPDAGFFLLALWLVLAIIFKYSSLSSMAIYVASPFVLSFFVFLSLTSILILILISAIGLIKHRDNIMRLLRHNENKIPTLLLWSRK